jgi:hypothetical protein
MPQRKVPALIIVGLLVACLAIPAVVATAWLAANKAANPAESERHHAIELARYRPNEQGAEIRVLMMKAVKGSPDAASHLAALYAHCHYGEPTKEEFAICAAKGKYWTDIAAENGSAVGVSYEIINLITTGKCTDAYRAEFWRTRLIAMQPDFPTLSALREDVANAVKNCSW